MFTPTEQNNKTQQETTGLYSAYLKTEQWQRVRQRRLAIDDYKCVACGSSEHLQIHHLTYAHIYHENGRNKYGQEVVYSDLVTLCADCHELIHRVMNRTTSPTGRKGWKHDTRIPQTHDNGQSVVEGVKTTIQAPK